MLLVFLAPVLIKVVNIECTLPAAIVYSGFLFLLQPNPDPSSRLFLLKGHWYYAGTTTTFCSADNNSDWRFSDEFRLLQQFSCIARLQS